jgi:hypothetical protein
MGRSQLIAFMVLAIMSVIVVSTVLSRMHEGRCQGGGVRGGLDCTHRPVPPNIHGLR